MAAKSGLSARGNPRWTTLRLKSEVTNFPKFRRAFPHVLRFPPRRSTRSFKSVYCRKSPKRRRNLPQLTRATKIACAISSLSKTQNRTYTASKAQPSLSICSRLCPTSFRYCRKFLPKFVNTAIQANTFPTGRVQCFRAFRKPPKNCSKKTRQPSRRFTVSTTPSTMSLTTPFAMQSESAPTMLAKAR